MTQQFGIMPWPSHGYMISIQYKLVGEKMIAGQIKRIKLSVPILKIRH